MCRVFFSSTRRFSLVNSWLVLLGRLRFVRWFLRDDSRVCLLSISRDVLRPPSGGDETRCRAWVQLPSRRGLRARVSEQVYVGRQRRIFGALALPFQLVSVQRHEGSPVSSAQVSLRACMCPSVFICISEFTGSVATCCRAFYNGQSLQTTVYSQQCCARKHFRALADTIIILFLSVQNMTNWLRTPSYLPTLFRRRDISLELDVQGGCRLEAAEHVDPGSSRPVQVISRTRVNSRG